MKIIRRRADMDFEIKQTERKVFQTSDLYLAAALKVSGFKFVDLRRADNGRGVFVFEDRPDRIDVVRSYFSGDLGGSFKEFTNAWSDMKSMISEMGWARETR